MQYTQTELINAALSAPDTAPMTLEQIVSQEIEDFRKSPQYAEILTAEEYYKNRSDNPANAGQTIRVTAPEGTYDITWDEGGHPVKAVRV